MPSPTPSGGAKYPAPHTPHHQAPQAPTYRSPPRRRSLMACPPRIRIHRPCPSPNRCRPLIPYREISSMITSTDLFASASPGEHLCIYAPGSSTWATFDTLDLTTNTLHATNGSGDSLRYPLQDAEVAYNYTAHYWTIRLFPPTHHTSSTTGA